MFVIFKENGWRYPQLLVSLAAILFSFILFSSRAYSFSEDICYDYLDSNKTTNTDPINPLPFNCWDVTCKDSEPNYNPKRSCAATGLETYINAAFRSKYHGRNMLHYDVVWLLARMLGMPKADADVLAAYSEATDLGTYTHYDYLGKPISGSTTDDIYGVQRTNSATFGFWLHFPPWYRLSGMTQATSSLTYTTPVGISSPWPAQEVPLTHLRAWAFGKRESVCEFGITTDPNIDTAPCVNNGGGTKTIDFTFPIFNSIRPGDTVPLDWQRIQKKAEGDATCIASHEHATCYVQGYDSAQKGTLRALAIYLHVMDDRLSHFACDDASSIETLSSGNFSLRYAESCSSATHAALHYNETGHSPVPERSLNAIRYTFYEISNWIAWKKTQAGGYATEVIVNASNYPSVSVENADSLVDMIGKALPRGIADYRIKALCKIAIKGYNLSTWHDNSVDCKY